MLKYWEQFNKLFWEKYPISIDAVNNMDTISLMGTAKLHKTEHQLIVCSKHFAVKMMVVVLERGGGGSPRNYLTKLYVTRDELVHQHQ